VREKFSQGRVVAGRTGLTEGGKKRRKEGRREGGREEG